MKKIQLIFFVLVISTLCGFDSNEKGCQRAFYECTDALLIDSSLFEINPGKVYFNFNLKLKPKNLKSQGFIWLKDNSGDYFTGYLINTSDSTINYRIQDGSLIMIQEALDKNGKWKPIEYWVKSGCGNSYFDPLELKPGTYSMIPIKKYTGNFKTKFRLKLKNYKEIFYSDTFNGSINETQFETPSENVEGILYHGPASYLDK
jgi:hypothetical protein